MAVCLPAWVHARAAESLVDTTMLQRKIRARIIRGQKCNTAILRRMILRGTSFVEIAYVDPATIPKRHFAKTLMDSAGAIRFIFHKTYCVHNTLYGCVAWSLHRSVVNGICYIKYKATESAGELTQDESVAVLLKETPDFSFFPAPTPPHGFQRKSRRCADKLYRGRQSGKGIVGVAPYSMAPKIQPSIGLLEYIATVYQPLGDSAGHAEKSIALSGIYGPIWAGGAAALQHPIQNV